MKKIVFLLMCVIMLFSIPLNVEASQNEDWLFKSSNYEKRIIADVNAGPGIRTVIRNNGYSSSTVSTTWSVSWSTATTAISSNAVMLLLHDSEIYDEHAVLAVGYTSFTHSSGWVSKYYAIYDGWTSDIRYVHSSLGIGQINMVKITYIG